MLLDVGKYLIMNRNMLHFYDSCRTYETALLLDVDISNELPYNGMCT